jgi:hypothetical protein
MFSSNTSAVSGDANYIEDVFSTWLYTGNGSARSITNEIDLSTKGGLVWIKDRTSGWANQHQLVDTARGATNSISSDSTGNQTAYTQGLTAFSSNGFSLGTNGNYNYNGNIYASWTFRKQPKFFDVVTYTGNGGSPSPLTVSHSLGSVPGCVIIKKTNGTADWVVFHRGLTGGLGSSKFIRLNTTAAEANAAGGIAATSTAIDIYGYTGSTDNTNDSGGTYVMYLFAHDAGGFGLTGTDNVISCGSFTTDGSGNATVTLGYEPQWLLAKPANGGGGDWVMMDTMRSWNVSGNTDAFLYANLSNAEATGNNFGNPTSTGFTVGGLTFSSTTYIYIAIRRGPMKTPTTGTSVFSPFTRTGTGAAATVTGVGFSPDWVWARPSASSSYDNLVTDKLRGTGVQLATYSTMAELSNSTRITGWTNDGFNLGSEAQYNASGLSIINWCLLRAPGFFDVVCYTGNNVYQQAQSHNLGVAPELIIVKQRSATRNWGVGCNFTNSEFQYLNLNSGADGGNTNAYTTGGFFGGKPTASTFILAQNAVTNASGGTYVAYLFATLAGVSKVGTYTGTGTTLQIDCGFTGGARFVLIKRLGTNTDAGVGDWYVWDSARGIVAGNDPYLLLNSTAAEVTNTDYIDTYSAGFEISSTAPAAINANGGTFIFLAIA